MNLYQAGYFRKGKQGSNSGWGVVSPSEGMGRMAIDGYAGIASNIVELTKMKDAGLPQVNRGIFKHDLFVYLLQSNFTAAGHDLRGVSYVHSYCFNNSEYYEMMKKPEVLLGVYGSEFPMDYTEGTPRFPVKENLAFEEYDFAALLQKYGLSDAEYRQLILGAICALESYSNSMCIKYAVEPDEYDRVSREIMYLIAKGLPNHLRIKMTYFSYKGTNATIYFSDKVQGNNYVDLDTKEFSCDVARLNTYEFTKIYNTVPAADYKQRDRYWETIDTFIETVFENSLRDVGVAQIEAGFQGLIKKNEEGIDPERAYGLLADFMKMSFKDVTEAYEYIAALLQVINDNLLGVKDDKLWKDLRKRYDKTESLNYKKQVCILSMGKLIECEEKTGYKILDEIRTSSPAQYEMQCSLLEENQSEYYHNYYLNSFMPVTLKSFDKIRDYIEKHPYMAEDERLNLLKIIRNVANRKIKENENFEANHKDSQTAYKLIRNVADGMQDQNEAKNIALDVFNNVWNVFSFSEFDFDCYDMYAECKVQKCATGIKQESGKNDKASMVLSLCELYSNDVSIETIETLKTALMTDEVFTSVADKEKLQKSLLQTEKFAACGEDTNTFDAFLLLYYSPKTGNFRVRNWAKSLNRNLRGQGFEPIFVNRIVTRSKLLSKSSIRQNFADSLENAIKNEKNNSDGKLNREEIRGCQKYLDGLCGKEIKDDFQLDEEANYLNVMHRAFIGFFALVTLGTGLFSLWSYKTETQTIAWFWVAFGVILAFIIAGIVGKFFVEGGLDGLIEESGMSESMMKLVIYLGSIVVMIIMAALFYFLGRASFVAKMIALIVYMVLAVAAAITYSLMAEE